jgi:hypothetical protein
MRRRSGGTDVYQLMVSLHPHIYPLSWHGWAGNNGLGEGVWALYLVSHYEVCEDGVQEGLSVSVYFRSRKYSISFKLLIKKIGQIGLDFFAREFLKLLFYLYLNFFTFLKLL